MNEVHGVANRNLQHGAEPKITAHESGGGLITVTVTHRVCALTPEEARYLAGRLRRMAWRIENEVSS